MFLIFLLVKNYRTQKVYMWSGLFLWLFFFLFLVVAVLVYMTSESPFGVILSC